MPKMFERAKNVCLLTYFAAPAKLFNAFPRVNPIKKFRIKKTQLLMTSWSLFSFDSKTNCEI